MSKIICGFPGIGKSTFFKECLDTPLTVSDSDSSNFDKSKFPENYINHIKSHIGSIDFILVSTHEAVLNELELENLDHYIVYPDKSLKEEYLERYKKRGSDQKFIKLLSDNWDDWIYGIEARVGDEYTTLIKLNKGQNLSDAIDYITVQYAMKNNAFKN